MISVMASSSALTGTEHETALVSIGGRPGDCDRGDRPDGA